MNFEEREKNENKVCDKKQSYRKEIKMISVILNPMHDFLLIEGKLLYMNKTEKRKKLR